MVGSCQIAAQQGFLISTERRMRALHLFVYRTPLSCQNISGTTSHDDNADDEVVRDVYYEKRLYPASHTRKRYLGLAPHSVTASKYSTKIPKIFLVGYFTCCDALMR